jgi:hypothetical protein
VVAHIRYRSNHADHEKHRCGSYEAGHISAVMANVVTEKSRSGRQHE